MKVELFYAVGCRQCATAREVLKTAAEQTISDLIWREVDVQKEMDYAVEVGVLNLPAVAIDGELAFSSLPTAAQLATELQRRRDREA